MTTSKYITILFLGLANFCLAQNEPNKKFLVNGGVEFRIVPYNFVTEEGLSISNKFFIYSRDQHLSGNSINLGIEYFF